MQDSKVTGIILAGGKSSRMGSNKALMLYKNQRLIDIAISVVKPLVNEILVSSNELIPNLSNRIISDVFENTGPIGGLYSCLKESNTDINLVIPCDVPLVSTSFYSLMLEKIESFDAVIPRHSKGKLEPLIGIYHKNVLPMMEEQINQHVYKLVNLLERLNVCYIVIPKSADLKNLNYPTDLL